MVAAGHIAPKGPLPWATRTNTEPRSGVIVIKFIWRLYIGDDGVSLVGEVDLTITRAHL